MFSVYFENYERIIKQVSKILVLVSRPAAPPMPSWQSVFH